MVWRFCERGCRYYNENRIIKIWKPGSPPTGLVEYSYDALGRRIERKDCVTAANTRRYYHNYNWQVLNEYDAAGTPALKKRYIYGNYIDEVLYMYDAAGDEDYYYARDHLYSTVALLDDSGAVVERYDYDAYGYLRIMAPDYATRTASLYGNEYFFTGRQLDIFDNGALKIYYYRNRYYDPHTGRFLTHDPLGYVDGMNLYGYVMHNPVSYTDPRGLDAVSPWNPGPTLQDPEIWDYLDLGDYKTPAIEALRSLVCDYRHCEVSGYNALIENKLIPALQHLPVYDFFVVEAKDDAGYIGFPLYNVSIPKGFHGADAFHEAIHVYNDWVDQYDDNPDDEAIATAASYMRAQQAGLSSVEDELRKDEPNLRILQNRWSPAWNGINGTIGSPFLWQEWVVVTHWGTIDGRHVSLVQSHLGYRLSCNQLAEIYNGILAEKGFDTHCTKFLCTPFCAYPSTNIILEMPLQKEFQ